MTRTPRKLADQKKQPENKRDLAIRRGQRGTFAKGQSGNPTGRPRGSRNKVTVMIETMLEGQAERLTQALIERALEGSTAAMDLIFARLAPVRKERTIEVEMPALKTMSDVVVAYDSVIDAATSGAISVGEAQGLASLLEMKRRAVETAELEKRLANIEERLCSTGGTLAH
jgi:hypothetical protein